MSEEIKIIANKLNEFAEDFLYLLFLVITALLPLIIIIPLFEMGYEAPQKDPLVEMIEQAEGKPVIVQTVKYGDDKKPSYARTYCQLLPFKRGIGDNQIECWVEVLK